MERWLARIQTGDHAPGARATAPGQDLADLVRRVRSSFLGRCVERFIDMQGIDRCVVLASQAFTALIPLLLLASALTPAGSEDVVADALIHRFGLEGESADSVTQLFAIPDGATSGVSLFSALLLVASGTSFARRLQKMYLAAWHRRKSGVQSGMYAALGLLILIAEFFVLYAVGSLVRAMPLSWLLSLPVSLASSVVFAISIPYLLMNRQVHWRRLAFGGVVGAIATTLYAFATTIYMPVLIEHYTGRYGLFGVTVAMIGWLLAIAFVLVASAVIAAEFDASLAPWALSLKTRFSLEDPAIERPVPTAADLDAGLTADDFLLLIRVLVSWGLLAVSVALATFIVPGIDVPGGWVAYFAVSLVLGLVSAILGAVPRLFLFRFSALITGLVVLVVNACLLVIVSWFSSGFDVQGPGAAIAGAVAIAAVSTILEVFWRPVRAQLKEL